MRQLLLLVFCISFLSNAQDPFAKKDFSKTASMSNEFIVNNNVVGTLLVPETSLKSPLIIFVHDQGVVDRNGNDMRSRHFAYKQLADSLLKQGIASYRYDKRTFTEIKTRRVSKNTLFDDFVVDLKEAIYAFSNDVRFSKIILLGHGQGSLISILASNQYVHSFISIAGSGQSIDDVIVEQIAMQQPGLDKVARKTFDTVLSQEKIVEDVEPDLYAIINPQMQPFMKSWMKYKPSDIASSLSIPVLILHGTNDRQVDVKQATLLHNSFPDSRLEPIEGMNHIFKMVGQDEIMASKSYIDPNFKISQQLIEEVVKFISIK
jgi:hypothetical protein